MCNTVKLSDENMNKALTQIESVRGTVSTIDITIDTLKQRRQVLTKDPTTYFDTMLKAADLIRELESAQKDGGLISIYKEAQGKTEILRKVLGESVSLSQQHFEDLLRKLSNEKEKVKSKHYMKQLSLLMTTMEKIFSRERYQNLFYKKYEEWVTERKREKERRKSTSQDVKQMTR